MSVFVIRVVGILLQDENKFEQLFGPYVDYSYSDLMRVAKELEVLYNGKAHPEYVMESSIK